MSEIIGVRFKEGGKIYYFRPNDEELEPGCHVVVETVRGTECGEMVMGRREIDDDEFSREIKTIIRKATQTDMDRVSENKIKEKKAFDICSQKIKAHGLEMNLLEVEYTFDNSKIIFNFSAEGRVDFRELVKDLAGVFRARIELRQIGVRDEAKMLGGLGVCGRPFCCKQFMGDFQSVSIKMAKEQGLSLNPVKISGTCGRLMCCLKHEQDAYEDLMRTMPQVGSKVMTAEGLGTIVDRELVAGRVKVRMDGTSEAPPKTFRVADVYDPDQPRSVIPAEDENDEAAGSTFGYPDFEESISGLPSQENGENRHRNRNRNRSRQGNQRRAEQGEVRSREKGSRQGGSEERGEAQPQRDSRRPGGSQKNRNNRGRNYPRRNGGGRSGGNSVS